MQMARGWKGRRAAVSPGGGGVADGCAGLVIVSPLRAVLQGRSTGT